VAEVIILRRLKEQEVDLHVIPDEQFGFRRTLSTELQVLRMTEYTTEGFNRKEATGAVLLDISKAFDRVWHRGLPIKMLDAGLVKLIRSFLSARESKSTAFTRVIGKWKQECRKVHCCHHFSITFMFQISLELSEPA